MRVRVTAKIDKTDYVVQELTIAEIIDFFENVTNVDPKILGDEAEDAGKEFMMKELQVLLDLALEGDHKVEDFIPKAPSELKLIYDAFKEANKVFFDIAAQMGMDGVLQGVRDSIQEAFSGVLALSSKAAIARSLPMDTPTS